MVQGGLLLVFGLFRLAEEKGASLVRKGASERLLRSKEELERAALLGISCTSKGNPVF